ncbi:MAG TPA: Fic family protein [Candidatus Dormibacteraeota bacterium]|nr:Fic family protein [Candidatus Dormibacteraeota bacterium]
MSNLTNLPARGRPSRQAVHQKLAFAVEELRTRLGGLPSPEEAEGIWTEIWHNEAHNSTALEGNTLVRKEVEVLLNEGRAVGDKELKDYLEVKGYAEAAKWVYGQALGPERWISGKLLTLTEVRQVHRLAMTPVWEVAPPPDAFDGESPGNWRQHDIRPFSQGMTPPEHPQIAALMQDWVDGVEVLPRDSSPIAEAIARHHAAFERIHPFLDGNGRVGRLLTNLILVRLGYPPAIIRKRERERYLDALARADREDPGPLGELLARAVIDNLTRFVLPAIAGPAKLVPLEALATQELSVIALRSAARRGRLKAMQASDGSWRSSKQWVDEYRKNRYAGLREPRKKRTILEEDAR